MTTWAEGDWRDAVLGEGVEPDALSHRHHHDTFVPGCWRCDLSRDELDTDSKP